MSCPPKHSNPNTSMCLSVSVLVLWTQFDSCTCRAADASLRVHLQFMTRLTHTNTPVVIPTLHLWFYLPIITSCHSLFHFVFVLICHQRVFLLIPSFLPALSSFSSYSNFYFSFLHCASCVVQQFLPVSSSCQWVTPFLPPLGKKYLINLSNFICVANLISTVSRGHWQDFLWSSATLQCFYHDRTVQ